MTQTILITGASSGIGKVTAQLFHDKGWNVVATMRSPEKEEDLSKLDNVLVTRLDVTDETSINEAVAAGIERFGQIDVLLNGTVALAPLLDHVRAFEVRHAKEIAFQTSPVSA